MIELILVVIGALIFWNLVARGFALGARATEATERTAELLAAALPPEARDRYVAMKERQAAEAHAAEKRKSIAFVVLAILAIFFLATQARAQGIYMLNGKATPSVIVGAAGEVFPVIPNAFCHGGPCPVYLAPPLPFRAYVRPPGYSPPPNDAPRAYTPPPPWAGRFDRYAEPYANPPPPPRARPRERAARPPLLGPFEREPDDESGR